MQARVQSHRSTAVYAFGLAAASAVWALCAPAPSRSQSVAAIVPAGIAPPRPTPVQPDPNAVQLPAKWAPSNGRECGKHGRGRPYCEGPRKVPLPFGTDAQRATQLGLGAVKTVSHLLLSAPMDEWVAAAGKLDGDKLLWPVAEGHLWRGYEAKRPPQHKHRHKGLDIGAPEGSLIHAVQSGIVAYANNEIHGYGNLLVIVHPDSTVTFYGHCRAIYVFAGQRVTRGKVVGEVGQTGLARGAHLHFEYRTKGAVRDPLAKFESRPCDPGKHCEDGQAQEEE